jgi:mxaL protein
MTRLQQLTQRLRTNLDAQLLLLLLVALGGPSAVLKREVFRFVFTFDVTQSMNVSDVAVSDAPVTRLDFAKATVRRTLERLPCGSQAGLAVFTEHRTFLLFAPVEVCENYAVLSTMLDRIDWRMAWAARSEVAKGLYSGLSLAAALGKETHLVFLTDGHEAPPVHPEFRPRFQGTPGEIAGAIIGVGGSEPAPIPRLDGEGKVVGYWAAGEVLQVDTYSLGRGADVQAEPMVGVDMSDVAKRIAAGTEHLSTLREAYLEQLAGETGLEYFHPETPQQLGIRLTQSGFADYRPAHADLRWLPGILAVLSLLFAYVETPALGRAKKSV